MECDVTEPLLGYKPIKATLMSGEEYIIGIKRVTKATQKKMKEHLEALMLQKEEMKISLHIQENKQERTNRKKQLEIAHE